MALSKEELLSILAPQDSESLPEGEGDGQDQVETASPSPVSPAPVSQQIDAGTLADILKPTPTPSPQQLLIPDIPTDDPVPVSTDQQSTTFGQKLKATGAAFAEGFVYGLDLFSVDDEVPLHPWVEGGARIMGEVTRMAGEMFLSAGIVSVVRGIPWIARAISAGGRGAKAVLQAIPGLGKLVNKAAPVAGVAAREAAEGLVYSGLDQLLAPEERKPGLEGTVMNVVQFGAGGIGFRAATRVTERLAPKAHPVLKRMVGFAGDTVTGALAAYGLYEDKSQIWTDIFAAETIAIGVIDLITYAMSKGRLNATPEALDALEKARRAKFEFDMTRSPDAEQRMWQHLDDAVRAGMPEGAGFGYEQKILEDIQKDWLADIERMRSAEAAPAEDVAARPDLGRQVVDVPSTPETPVRQAVEPPTAAEAPAPAQPRPVSPEQVRPEAPEVATHRPTDRITGQGLVEAFGYKQANKAAEIDRQLQIMRTYASQAGFTLDQIAALAKIESDFRDIGVEGSTARGPLMITETALRDMERLGIKLENDINTLEGRIEAGIKYLQVLRDNYKLTGDEIIAAYFAGPTYVRRNGITDEVIAGQISTAEYVRRYKEALATIRRVGQLPTPLPREPEGFRPTPEPRRPLPGEPEGFRPTPESRPAETPPTPLPGEPEGFRPTPEPRPVEAARAPEAEPPKEVNPETVAQVVESAAPSPEPFQPRTTQDVRTVRSVVFGDDLVFLKFASDADALLYDYAGRRREEPAYRFRLEYLNGLLKRELGLPEDADLDTIAREWRRGLNEKARSLQPEQVLQVPPLSRFEVEGLVPGELRRLRGETAAPEPGPVREPELVREPEVIREPEGIREPEPVREPEVVREPEAVRESEVVRDAETVREPERLRDAEVIRDAEPAREPEEPERRPAPEAPSRMAPEIRRVWDISKLPELESRAIFGSPESQRRILDPETFRDTSQAHADYQKHLKEFEEWLLKHPGEVTPERLRELQNFIKPSMGFSINTTRLRSSGAVLDSIHRLADIVNDPRSQSLRDVERGARKLLRQEALTIGEQIGLLKKDAELLAAALAKAPETVTAFRGAFLSLQAETFRRAQDIAAKGVENATDLELAQYEYLTYLQASMASTIKQINRQLSRTLGAGRIIVGDRFVDLTELNLDDLIINPEAAQKVSTIVETGGGREAIVKKAKRMVEAKNSAELTKIAREEANPKVWMRAIAEQRSASLLTNFRTAFTNFLSQIFNAATEHAINFTAAGINLIRRSPGGMTFGEASARLIGEITGAIHAFVRPIVRVSDGMGIKRARKLPSIIDIISMMIHDPVHLATNLEKAMKPSALTARMDVEGMRGEYATSEKLRNTPQGRAITKIMDILGSPIRIVSLGKIRTSDIMWAVFDQAAAAQRILSYGMMELADRPFAYGGYYAELSAQLYRRRKAGENVDGLFEQVLARRKEKMLAQQIEQEALASGLTGEALEAKRREIRDRITGGVLKDLSEDALKRIDEIDQAALENARYMTFKDPIETPALRTFEGVINKHPFFRLFLPFYHTPVRIFEKAASMTPFLSFLPGFLPKTRADLLGRNGKAAQNLALARWAVGAALYATGMSLASSNQITPTASSESEARRMREAGLPEHSIKIGDKWVDINKFDPAPAMFFTTMANLYKVLMSVEDDESAEEIASAAFFAILRSVLDKTWLTSLRTTLDAIYGYGSDNWVAELIDTTIPFKGLRNMAQTWPLGGANPFYRDYMMEVNGLLERFNPQRPALDTFGKPVEAYGHFMGLRLQEATKSPIRQELVKLGLTLPKLDKVVDHVELDADQYWELRRILDAELNAEERLNRLVKTPQYQRASTERKKEMILDLWNKLKQEARTRIKRRPWYREKYQEYRQRLLTERARTEYPLPDYFQ